MYTRDFVIGAMLWVLALVSFISVLVGVSHAVDMFASNSTAQTVIAKLSDDMSTYASDAHAIITPPTEVGGGANCNASDDCREVDYLFRTTTGDVYLAFDFVPPTSGKVGLLKVYTFSGFTSANAHISPVLRQTIPMQAFSVHPVLASAMNSDTQDQFASLVSTLESQAGITPQDVTLDYGAPLAIARNAVYIVSVTSSTGGAFSFQMTQESIAPKNLRLDVGTYAPTPPPTLTYSGDTLVYHWPTDTGASSFQVSEAYYHDPFFAEQGTCASVAAPSPQYIPGSSPTYYPSTMFGQTGPWTYPNPNPTSPPGQNSGPATFATAPAAGNSGGYCSYYVYDVYTNRSSGTPSAKVPVQVMGWLTLTNGSSTATSQTTPLVLPALAKVGDSDTVSASKSFDNDSAGLRLTITLDSTCAQYVAAGPSQYDGASSSAPTATESAHFIITATSLPTALTTCGGTVSDQYGEPVVSFLIHIDPALSANPCGTPDPNALVQIGSAAVNVNQLKKDADSGLTGRDGKPLTSDGAETYGFFDFSSYGLSNPKGVYYMTENNDGTITFVMYNSYNTQMYGTPGQNGTLTGIVDWFEMDTPSGTALNPNETSYGPSVNNGTYPFVTDPTTTGAPVVLAVSEGPGSTGPNVYGIFPLEDTYNAYPNGAYYIDGFMDGSASISSPMGGSSGSGNVLQMDWNDAAPLFESVPGTGQNQRVLRLVWPPLAPNGTLIPPPSVVEFDNSAVFCGSSICGGNNTINGMSNTAKVGLTLKCQNYAGGMPAVSAPQKPTLYSWTFSTTTSSTKCGSYNAKLGGYKCTASYTATLQSDSTCTQSGTLSEVSDTNTADLTLPNPATVTDYWPLQQAGWSKVFQKVGGTGSSTGTCPLNPNIW